MNPLVDEAMKKAAIAWLTIPGSPAGTGGVAGPSTPAGPDQAAKMPRWVARGWAIGAADKAGPATAVWCLWIDGALYVVSGTGEQPAPGLAEAEQATVSVRGDHGGRILSWPAAVARVWPGDEEWAAVAGQLAGKRLNAGGTTAETVERWAQECVVSKLTPAGEPSEAGPTLTDDSGAAAPRPTPAAHRAAKPLRLHRVRRPR